MNCQVCGTIFNDNDLIIRAIVCKIINKVFDEIECDGNYPSIDMHFRCFEGLGNVSCKDEVGTSHKDENHECVVEPVQEAEETNDNVYVQRTDILGFMS